MGDEREALEQHLDRLSRAAAGLGATGWSDRTRVLGAVGARFLDPTDRLRRLALERLPTEAGLSREQSERLLGEMARDWTGASLEALVRAEFEDPAVLDRWVDDRRAPDGRRLRAFPLATGVGLHICAGTVPGVAVSSLVRGLLVGSPVLLKPGAGDQTLPRLFLDGLSEMATTDPRAASLSDACAAMYWRGGVAAVENAALSAAGYVVVYGASETIADVRGRTAPTTPVVAYGHRVGLAIVGAVGNDTGSAVADAVADFDQRGCVSPHQVFVRGSPAEAERLAEEIAGRLEVVARERPAGPPRPEVASAVQQLRGGVELRRAAGQGVRVWAGPGVSWTVVLDPVAEIRPPYGSRTVHVTPVASIAELESVLKPARRFLQSVGVAGFDAEGHDALVERLARWGASRIVPLDRLAFPPAWWIHDGQGPLRRLVRWAESGPTPDPAVVPPAR